ncbi:MAG: acyl-CoA thioesterase [Gammaproteobacteria bacterium]|nr:acyl-CoA thioesterase [Gammaproteobacteria bacterium]
MTEKEFRDLYPFVIEDNVEWDDMDAFQHVNNKVYFRYFEKIRILYFEDNKLLDLVKEKQLGPILASTQCRFKFPLTYPDNILIGTSISDLHEDRFLMNYAVYSLGHQKMAAVGDGLIVCYDYAKGEKAVLPEEIHSVLATQAVSNAGK